MSEQKPIPDIRLIRNRLQVALDAAFMKGYEMGQEEGKRRIEHGYIQDRARNRCVDEPTEAILAMLLPEETQQ